MLSLPAQPLGADGVVLAEAALEGAAGEEHRAAAPGAADAGLLPEVQGSAGRFQGTARPAEARLPGGPVGFALPKAKRNNPSVPAKAAQQSFPAR